MSVHVRGRDVKVRSIVIWSAVALLGAVAWGILALARGEEINAVWLLFAAVCSYAIAYRFYARFIAKKVLGTDDKRATPAERLDNSHDFQPTDRRVLFGHHFAAIAGAGPLVGPVLAAQMGYLPGTLWIVVGVIFAGAVQDMVILFFSMRRDGKSLGQMARDEIGPVGGVAALIAVFSIMIILLAVLALVVVQALAESPWGTFSIAMTIPIALLMGFYMRVLRPGRVLETTAIGVALLILAILAGGWVQESDGALADFFTLDPETLVICLVVYGFAASVLPVWMLLAPRDYLSTFMKIGTIALLALGILFTLPVLQNERVTEFASNGQGPVFAGALFPFVFIIIACGALSGFHSLIASGTTPKMIEKETQVRTIGYGAMLMESFVAVMAITAASILDPGLYFAMNAPAGVVGDSVQSASTAVRDLGFTDQPRAAAVGGQLGGGGDAGGPHRRRAHAGRRNVGDLLRRDRRKCAEGLLVPLRDHVRGPVHPHHGGRGNSGRALHAAGHARQHLEADRPRVLEARPLGHQRAGGGGLGLLPLGRRHRSARRHQPAVPAVRHRQPAAGGGRAHRRHHDPDQERQAEVGLGHAGPARVGRHRHAHRQLAEGVLGRPQDRLLRPARRLPRGDRRREASRCRPLRAWRTWSRSSPTPPSTASWRRSLRS